MKQSTIDKLNKINQDFYFRISKYWNNNEDSAWYGWNTLLPILKDKFKNKKEIAILDLGCGNARFATFVKSNFPDLKINYVGLDTDPQFLENGSERNKENFGKFRLIQADLIKDNWIDKLNNKESVVIPGSIGNPPAIESGKDQLNKTQKFDLVVLFGILHHIPSLEARQSLLKQASEYLEINGTLIFTGWRFLDKERLQKRVLDPKQLFYKHALNFFGLHEDELEENDYLLDWVKYEYSIRYAHYISNAEAEDMVYFGGLQITDHFIDDSLQRDQNNYWLCKKRAVILGLIGNPQAIENKSTDEDNPKT
jgi:tRNA (uracil-5-)-methyltransferase TRM9